MKIKPAWHERRLRTVRPVMLARMARLPGLPVLAITENEEAAMSKTRSKRRTGQGFGPREVPKCPECHALQDGHHWPTCSKITEA